MSKGILAACAGTFLVLTLVFATNILACGAIVLWHGYWVVFDPRGLPDELGVADG